MKYTIEDLIKTFADHAKETEERNKRRKEKYPDAIVDEFNISSALLAMCQVIKRLKK